MDPISLPFRGLLAVHVAGVVLWVGGLVALGYVLRAHVEALEQGTSLRKFRMMERSLLVKMVIPGILVGCVAGVALLVTGAPDYLATMWMKAKLLLSLLLVAVTIVACVKVWPATKDPVQLSLNRFPANLRIGTLTLAALVLLLTYGHGG